MKKTLLLMASAVVLLTSCKDNKEDAVTEKGTVINVNDNTACTLYIKLDSGLNIDPLNKTAKEISPFLTDSNRVTVTYRIDNDFQTPCPNAKPVEVVDIQRISE